MEKRTLDRQGRRELLADVDFKQVTKTGKHCCPYKLLATKVGATNCKPFMLVPYYMEWMACPYILASMHSRTHAHTFLDLLPSIQMTIVGCESFLSYLTDRHREGGSWGGLSLTCTPYLVGCSSGFCPWAITVRSLCNSVEFSYQQS